MARTKQSVAAKWEEKQSVARGAEPPPPSQPLAKEEADGGGGDGERRGAPPLGTEAVTRLAALFDGRMGGSVEDERICGWLRPLLGVV